MTKMEGIVSLVDEWLRAQIAAGIPCLVRWQSALASHPLQLCMMFTKRCSLWALSPFLPTWPPSLPDSEPGRQASLPRLYLNCENLIAGLIKLLPLQPYGPHKVFVHVSEGGIISSILNGINTESKAGSRHQSWCRWYMQEAKEQVFWPFIWAGNLVSKASSLIPRAAPTATPALADTEGNSSTEQLLAEPVTAEIDDEYVEPQEGNSGEESDKESEVSQTKVWGDVSRAHKEGRVRRFGRPGLAEICLGFKLRGIWLAPTTPDQLSSVTLTIWYGIFWD